MSLWSDVFSGVSVERVSPSSPGPIFDLLADPRRHRELDGSGTLRDAFHGPERLHLGARFGMSMNAGASYRMINEVVEFDADRLLAWQPRPDSGLLARLIGGRIFRYQLEPVEGGTRVRQTWDISQERIPALVLPLRSLTRLSMGRTLARIEELVT